MKIFREFGGALKAYIEAHKVIVRLNLWKYFIAPIVAGVAFTIAFYFLAVNLEASIADDPDYLLNMAWYRRLMDYLMGVVYWPTMIWLYTVSYKYVVLALISPILSRVSEIVERRLTGEKPDPYSFSQLLEDIGRAFKLAFRNLLWETVIGIFLLFIPYVRAIFVFLVASFYSGFSIMDYTLERKRYDVGESIKFMRGHRGMALGLGIPFYGILLVPIIGVAIVPIYGVVAATLEILKLEHPLNPGADEDEEEEKMVNEEEPTA